jgi:predicted membrane channel-forming protein YqfA (hemolysin III family)
MRAAVRGAALLFILAVVALTVHAAASGGIAILTVLSVFVLGLLALRIVGALLHPAQR